LKVVALESEENTIHGRGSYFFPSRTLVRSWSISTVANLVVIGDSLLEHARMVLAGPPGWNRML